MNNLDDPTVQAVTELLRGQRWAALATVGDGMPHVSQVAFVCKPTLDSCLFHLSKLALHTRNLLAHSQASLSIGVADDGRDDPQTLARISLQGSATPIGRGDRDWLEAQRRYLTRFPASERTFGFADFTLFRMQVTSARYVGGFADAHTLSAHDLATASRIRA